MAAQYLSVYSDHTNSHLRNFVGALHTGKDAQQSAHFSALNFSIKPTFGVKDAFAHFYPVHASFLCAATFINETPGVFNTCSEVFSQLWLVFQSTPEIKRAVFVSTRKKQLFFTNSFLSFGQTCRKFCLNVKTINISLFTLLLNKVTMNFVITKNFANIH